jgi:hypothetical protein
MLNLTSEICDLKRVPGTIVRTYASCFSIQVQERHTDFPPKPPNAIQFFDEYIVLPLTQVYFTRNYSKCPYERENYA